MKKLLKIVCVIRKPKILKFLLGQYDSGYLNHIGWFESLENEKPTDKDMNPLPWVTYPFIEFIKNRLDGVDSLFEFGSGNSTLFYSKYVKSVDAVEHDIGWFEHVKSNMPSNVRLIYRELDYGENYCRAASEKKYDLIIIDGRDRSNCIYQSISSLNDNGCIILDDSERETYSEASKWLIDKQGFKKIDFWGISPGLFHLKNTTVFYKVDNVLGI